MAFPARTMAKIRALSDGRGDLAKLATGGAWLFAIASLFPLVWLLREGGDGAVFATQVAGERYTIPLLNYGGAAGMLLLCAELLAIAGAFLLTVAPRVPRKLVRVGHGVLIAWSLVWTLGTWRLATVDPGFWTLQALFLTALCGCTVWRAVRNGNAWRPNASGPTPLDSRAETAEPSYFNEASNSLCGGVQAGGTSASTRQQIVEAIDRAKASAVAAMRTIAVGVKAGIAAARNHHAKV